MQPQFVTGPPLPDYVRQVAFSCRKRGFCTSCGPWRMAETAALLADKAVPKRPRR